MFKSVLLKVSGEELAGKSKSGFDDEIVKSVARQILEVTEKGVKVSLVIGGGNFWRGRDTQDGFDRVKSDNIGMLATVMNAVYFADVLRVVSGGSVAGTVMTPFAVGAMTELFNKDNALERQAAGNVVLFAGGTGHPFFSTDMIAAIRARELGCGALLFAKPVDGFYTSDPNKDKNAVKIPRLTYDDITVKKLGAIDLTAACFLAGSGVKTVLFKLGAEKGILTAATGSEDEILKIGSIVE